MAGDNHIKNYTAADIEKYHEGRLSAKEKHDLEKAALDDPFLADALEGYAVAGVNAEADLAELKSRLSMKMEGAKVIEFKPRENKRRAIPWLRIAVMLVILVGAGILANQLLFKNKKSEIADAGAIKKEETKITDTTVPLNTDPATGKEPTVTTKGNKTDKLVESGIKTESSANAEEKDGTVSREKTDKASDITLPVLSPVTPTPVKDIEAKDEATTKALAKEQKEQAKQIQKNKTVPVSKGETGKDLVVTASETPAGNNNKYYNEGRSNASNRYNNQTRAANTFRGAVMDNNNRGLPFANVTNTRDNVGTYTDVSGNFTLTSPDTVLSVQVRSVGFEDNIVQLRNDVPANQVVMQDDRKNLSEVIVSTQKPNAERRQRDANLKLEEPEPADGWENYDVYLVNNRNLPEEYKTRQSGKQEVEVSFEVNKNGEPTNIRVEKSLCKTCDKEAIRLVKEGPKWKRKAKKGRTTVTVSF